MATLADTFLDDLDELGESSDEEAEGEDEDQKLTSHDIGDMEVDGGHGRPVMPVGKNIVKHEDLDSVLGQLGASDITKVARLRNSQRYRTHMAQVDASLSHEPAAVIGPVEDDPEYKLIVASNQLIQDIDEEILKVHRFVVDLYCRKFPELESLIPNRLEYVRTVQVIQNEMDMTTVDLDNVLPQTTVMVVSVTGSTTSGQKLPEEDLQECLKGCEEFMELHSAKGKILSFVESRMTHIAPNVSCIIGSRIAAQLMGLCAGLTNMARIPSCNLQVMGQEKKHLAGFSSAAAVPHAGLIYHSELVQSLPPYLRMKGLKVAAAKVTLAARCDSYGQDKDGAVGRQLRDQLEDKFEKWQEPPKAKTKKALPKPEEGMVQKKKRGGKRVRKWKEKYAMTDVRKEANKMAFGQMDDEYGDSAMGRDFGMLGKQGGRLRGAAKKEQKNLTQSKKLKVAANLSSGNTNGLASSLVFTPIQGLELVNPNAAEDKVKEANKKWFNTSSGFASAKPR